MQKKELIWVYRRHPDHPTMLPGFRWVEPDVARKMIDGEYAQHHGTDQRRLKPMETAAVKPDPAPEPMPVEELDAPQTFTLVDEPETESTEDEAPKPKPRATRKPRTYKRRDMTAED